ncbi:hypothetical protein MRX96_019067 [Rhipicephalus microplus]
MVHLWRYSPKGRRSPFLVAPLQRAAAEGTPWAIAQRQTRNLRISLESLPCTPSQTVRAAQRCDTSIWKRPTLYLFKRAGRLVMRKNSPATTGKYRTKDGGRPRSPGEFPAGLSFNSRGPAPECLLHQGARFRSAQPLWR